MANRRGREATGKIRLRSTAGSSAAQRVRRKGGHEFPAVTCGSQLSVCGVHVWVVGNAAGQLVDLGKSWSTGQK